MAYNPADLLFQIREYWAKTGGVAEAWSDAGKFWKMISKGMVDSWMGEGVAKLPIKDRLSGNGGPNFTKVFGSTETIGGIQFGVKLREHYELLNVTQKLLALGRNPAAQVDMRTYLQTLMEISATSSNRQLSYLMCSDGTGRIAKGDGAYSVAGTEIVFKNANCFNRFEVGDVIVLIDEAAAVPVDGQPTPRAGTLTVTNVSRRSITVNAAVNTIVGAANTDYIGKDSYFGSNEGLVDGIQRWVPLTETEAATTLFGVDRSENTPRRAGTRIDVSGVDSPYDVLSKIMAESQFVANGGNIDTVMVPASAVEELSQEAKANSLQVIETRIEPDMVNQVVGFTAVKLVGMDFSAMVIADQYWCDIESTVDDDVTYLAFPSGVWECQTADGYGWKNYGDNGRLHGNAGSQELTSQYGMFGNLFCLNPASCIVTSRRANT